PWRFIWPRPIACDSELPRSIDGTESMCVWSDTAVRPRIAVSMVCPKSGESMALAMLREPRLQEMSLPTWEEVRSSLYVDGVESGRSSEHRLECVILPATGLARFTVSSYMMYGYPDSNCSSATVWKKCRALTLVLVIRLSSTISWKCVETSTSANGLP